MKIRTQFWFTMVLFGLLVIGTAVSVFFTNNMVNDIRDQEEISNNIDHGAQDLNYLASSYLIYGEQAQLDRWQTTYTSFSRDINSLKVNVPEQQTLVDNLRNNAQTLDEVFKSIIAANPTSTSGVAQSFLQVNWSRISVQTQGLASDASHLTQLLNAQADGLRQLNLIAILVMIFIFFVFFVFIFILVQRRTLKSLAILNSGTKVVGGGNLDHVLDIPHNDEVGELARAFNHMTVSLKEVTTSRLELEKEIAERKKVEETLREHEERLSLLYNSMTEGLAVHKVIFESDKATDYVITDVNPAYEAITGLKKDEAVGRRASGLYGTGKPPYIDIYSQVAKTGAAASFETYFPPMKKHFGISVFSPRPGEFATVFSDISDRKQYEEELWRVNRELRAISDCNQAMVRATDEQTLLDDICRIMCESAGYRMAWIGSVEHDEAKSIKPVAWGGMEDGYLKNVAITWSETERGRGPTGIAVRTAKTQFFQDFDTDPAAAPWREAALVRDYRSSIALPLIDHSGGVFAVLIIYASRPNAFIPTEVKLLEELAGDLAFGIDVLRIRKEQKRLEEDVSRQAMEWQETFDSLPDMISIQDKAMRLVRVNKAYESFAGMSQSDLLGRKCWEIVHCTQGPPELCPNVQTLQKGKAITEEIYEPRLGIYLEVSTSPLVGEKGELTGTVHIAKDITERKRADEQLREYVRMLDLAQILVKDMQSRIIFWNEGMERMYGYSKEEALGNLPHELLQTMFPEPREDIQNKVLLQGRWDGELTHISKYGEKITVATSWIVHYGENGEPLAIIEALNDISAIKEAEESLRKRTEELEDANKELESFTYSVSHDLREPLRAIDGFTRILYEDYSSKLDEEGHRVLSTVLQGTKRMDHLISDLLSFSRISRKYMSSSVVNMNELAVSVVEELKEGMPDRVIETRIGPLVPGNGDAAMIKQVLTNLVSNAIKFTRPREKAVIEIGCMASNTENIYYVKDNGVGFDSRYAGKLFNMFQRLHRQEQFEGSGVGLAIVYRIIHRHGGRVWAESEPDKGATFYFSLPRGVRNEIKDEGSA